MDCYYYFYYNRKRGKGEGGGGLPDRLHVVVGMLEEDTVGAHEVHQND